MDEALTAEDYESVARAVGDGPSLNEQVAAWGHLVEQVEGGYAWSVYEYVNDLSVRRSLERIRGVVTSRVRASLDERLHPLDQRFLVATEPSERMAGTDWWSRAPRLLVGELASDLPRTDGG